MHFQWLGGPTFLLEWGQFRVLTDPMFGGVAPDETVKLVFNLSQGEDLRGPWNEAPEFNYIEDPEPQGGMPQPPMNADDEGHTNGKARARAR